jgi:hypothetical protein
MLCKPLVADSECECIYPPVTTCNLVHASDARPSGGAGSRNPTFKARGRGRTVLGAPVPDLLEALLAAYAVVFVVNLVPAFMPPTWSILAYFLIRFDLPLLPLAVGGALAASSGRCVLALASNRYGRRVLSPGRREN